MGLKRSKFTAAVCLKLAAPFLLIGLTMLMATDNAASQIRWSNFASPSPQESGQTNPRQEVDDRTDEEKQLGIFPRSIPLPDFPKDGKWLNTGGPIRKADLKGKFVVIDFWTYCCINCIHILPELKKLEEKYPNEVVVIGCHSAKFEAEQDSTNITQAVMRYEIKHPVLNDIEMRYWNRIGARSWPTVLIADPDGGVFWARGGEVTFELLDSILKTKLDKFKKNGKLDTTPVKFRLAEEELKPTPLRFPGKILADPKSDRLFISDSNHNRIVIASLDGKFRETIGSGAIGRKDGDFKTAEFDHPQGMALHNEMLYVADTENHLIRKVDLKQKTVTTIAGTGVQQRKNFLNEFGEGGHEKWFGDPMKMALNSPWALLINNGQLIIAMAGNHQVWTMLLDESTIGLWAGNGREDIVDGNLLPGRPYQLGTSSFAQPSGLTADKNYIYLADSEGSSIRKLPLSGRGQVETLVGTADRERGRLFIFGDVDGKKEDVLLQHPLGVAHYQGKVYVADTYNNKIKQIDAKTGETKTIAGTGKPGNSDEDGTFDEPSGLAMAGNKILVTDTNNHLIRQVDIKTGRVSTLTIVGLQPPKPKKVPHVPTFPSAIEMPIDRGWVTQSGQASISVRPKLPDGWKITADAPAVYKIVQSPSDDPESESKPSISHGKALFKDGKYYFDGSIDASTKSIDIYLRYYYCQSGGEGLCKVGAAKFKLSVQVSEKPSERKLELSLDIKPQ